MRVLGLVLTFALTFPALAGELRFENIRDEEVREIKAVVAELEEGPIVGISGVLTGCPCEEGPACTDHVPVVVYRPAVSVEIFLSKIDGHWTLGPLEQWDRSLEDYRSRWPDDQDRFMEYFDGLLALLEQRPKCAAEHRR